MTNYFIEIVENVGENWKQFNIIEEADLDIGNSNISGSPHCTRFIETERAMVLAHEQYIYIDKPVSFSSHEEARGYKRALDKIETERLTAWEKERA